MLAKDNKTSSGMHSSRGSWAESNRQLWTSSSDAGQRQSGTDSLLEDTSTINASSVASALGSASEIDAIAVVTKECQESGGRILSSHAESALTSLLGATGTEAHTKNLVSVLLATNARRRKEEEERTRNDEERAEMEYRVKSVVDEIAACINGESPNKEEDLQDSLYRVLLSVEKCAELVQLTAKGSKLSLRDALLELYGARKETTTSQHLTSLDADVNSSSVHAGVIEVLESHGYLASREDDVGEAVLKVIKDIERIKRETQFLGVLLRQYELTVRNRLAFYGDTNPPSTEEEKTRLLADSDSSAHISDVAFAQKPWWKERVSQLCDHLSRIPPRLTVVELPKVVALDVSSSAETTQRSIASLIDATDTSIVALFHECVRSRELAQDLFHKLKAASLFPVEESESADGNDPLWLHGPVSKLLEEMETKLSKALGLAEDGNMLKSRGNDTLAAKERQELPNDEADCVIPATKLLGLVVEHLPTSVRAKFGLEPGYLFSEKRATQLLAAIAYLNEHSRDTIHRIDGLCARLRETFGMDRLSAIDGRPTDDRTLADQLSFLEDAVSAACRRSAEAVSSESCLTHEVRQSIEELAQLLPMSPISQPQQMSSDAPAVRIAPPTDDILEMTRILKSRLLDWQQTQAKRNSAGEHHRQEKVRLEESIKTFTSSAQALLTDLLSMSIVETAEEGVNTFVAADSESESAVAGVSSPNQLMSSLTATNVTLSDVLERLKVVKTRYARAVQASAALRSRVDSMTTQAKMTQKQTRRVVVGVTAVCELLGITAASLGSADRDCDNAGRKNKNQAGMMESKEKGAYGKLNLRADKPAAAALSERSLPASGTSSSKITEDNVVEALQLVATRIAGNDALVKQSMKEGELERLQAAEKRAERDTVAFRQAISVILSRLAENGQLVKQSLYLLGTDESPKDDVVDSVLRKTKEEGSVDANGSSEDEHETNERLLASLLQKYSRWSRRLIETTEDHLDTQQKLVKYFAAVQRYFASLKADDGADNAESTTAPPCTIMDENLIDIDTTLMRFADVILPALDRTLRRGGSGNGGTNGHSTAEGALLAPSKGNQSSSAVDARGANEADEESSGPHPVGSQQPEGLPYDHRLGRLYETIGRLHIIMTSLLRVRYLSVPSGSRQRSSGDTELLFDAEDSIGNGFVDLDLDKLVRVSVPTEPERFSRERKDTLPSQPLKVTSVPLERIAANNDLIYRVAAQNLDCVYQAMRKFSSTHKMAAILVQKDTDAVQERVAAMLEKYSELDIEQAFGQDRQELHEMYAILKERGTRQKGCYFFNRINGEGDCVWVRALDRLGTGFGAIVDKLVERTVTLAQSRELVNSVVDLCAMYVNWAETTPLPDGHSLPEDVRVSCVRDEDGDKNTGSPDKRVSGKAEAIPGALPPIPVGSRGARTPAMVASSPTRTPDNNKGVTDAISKGTVGGSASMAADSSHRKVSFFREDDVVLKVMASMFQLAQAGVEGGLKAASQELHQLEEEVQLLKEANAVAERRVAQAEQDKAAAELEKNRAFSEAAVAKAELRRWKKLAEAGGGGGDSPHLAIDDSSHDDKGTSGGCAAEAVSTEAAKDEKGEQSSKAGRDGLQEMLLYMKALSEELHFANHVATGRLGSRHGSEETGDMNGDALACETAVRAQEAQHRLDEQYGNTPLRVVAEASQRGYADALGRTHHRRSLVQPSAGTMRQRSRERAFFPDKTPKGFGHDGDVLSPRYRSATPCEYAPTPGHITTAKARPTPEEVSSRKTSSSVTPCRRARTHSQQIPGEKHSLSQQRRAVRGNGRLTPSQDIFFDADPLLPASSGRRDSPHGWVQDDGRPRTRYASPSLTSGVLPSRASSRTGQREFTDILRTIETEAERSPLDVRGAARTTTAEHHQSSSANVNVRTAALRRLAEVVSKTKVRGPTGGQF